MQHKVVGIEHFELEVTHTIPTEDQIIKLNRGHKIIYTTYWSAEYAFKTSMKVPPCKKLSTNL